MDKKGNIVAISIVGILVMAILILGTVIVFGSATLNYVADTVVPEISGIGVVGDSNISEYSEYTITPVNTVVQSFTWLSGVMYIIAVFLMIGVAFAFRGEVSNWSVVFFFMVAILVVTGSIFVSNVYEEFHDGTDDIAQRLQEHTILSFGLIYSPLIMTVLLFIMGAIMFTGGREDFT